MSIYKIELARFFSLMKYTISKLTFQHSPKITALHIIQFKCQLCKFCVHSLLTFSLFLLLTFILHHEIQRTIVKD